MVEVNRPEGSLRREMLHYFSEVFDDLILKEQGYSTTPDAVVISHYTFTRVS
jgi:hypothetical protein